MTVNILACPSCKSLVLARHGPVPELPLRLRREACHPAEPARPVGRVEAPEEEVPCPGCNELVRKGLVRCWNCGTFMQQDIAESYRKMQISPPKVIYSEVNQTATDAGSLLRST